ncbi:beta-propeller domain-containing protein [Candidatus Gracilibacteria bacterium]|nr:beta-propeller domain-containing protein [Candidatus Gracilibacteria bacterium]
MKNKIKILLAIGIIFFLNFQNIQFVNADFSSWLFEKISSILKIEGNQKTSIGDFTKKIEENSDELKKILDSKNVLEKVNSCDVLSEIIKKNHKNQPVPILYRNMGIMEESASNAVSLKSNSFSGGIDFSKTNVQVNGVDEGDIVKNDGRFIYILSNSKKSVKIFDAKKSVKIGEILFSEKNFSAKEIFINDGKLVLIGTGWEEDNFRAEKNKKIAPPKFGGKNFVKIFIYNLKKISEENFDAKKFFSEIKPERKIFFEGGFSQSRLIGENLFLITKKYSRNFWWGSGHDEDLGEKNIPEFFDGKKFKKIAKCGDVEFFPGSEKTDFVVVSKINLSDKNTEIEKKIFLGDLDKIYMSQKNLFIATGIRGENGNFWNWDNTQIVKIGLENLELKNIGKVKGRILNQFSMDEFEGNFRIATTNDEDFVEKGEKGEEIFGTERQNNVFILDQNLVQIGALTGIAKGENIKSVRFMGNRAFLVTFKNMDPFFVLDLEDPKNPKILGELKIPGWSDYLHPFGENFILGFGKDAKEVGEGEDLIWEDVGGMKISLFDVSDLENPKEKFLLKVGARGTFSDVLNNHRALFFEQKSDDEAILGFHLHEKNELKFEQKNCFEFSFSNCPIKSCQKRCTPTSLEFTSGDCDGPGSCIYKRFQNNIWTTFAGAVFLDVSKEKGFSELKRISNFSKKDYEKNQYFWEQNEKKISRIVRIGDKYFGISEDIIFEVSSDFGEVKKVLIK